MLLWELAPSTPGSHSFMVCMVSGDVVKVGPALQTDAILKVTSTCICGSDLHLYLGFVPGMEPGEEPLLPQVQQFIHSRWLASSQWHGIEGSYSRAYCLRAGDILGHEVSQLPALIGCINPCDSLP